MDIKTENTTEEDETRKPTVLWLLIFSKRWRLTYLLFCAYGLLYMLGVNLSLAVVCMVKSLQTSTIQLLNTPGISANESANIYDENGFGRNSSYTLVNSQVDMSRTGCASENNITGEVWDAELDWEKSHVSVLLSSYFYGSFITQTPAGKLADKFGGKNIITCSMLIQATCTLLTPICARTSIVLVFVVRIILGLASGFIVAPLISMFHEWAPPDERTTMMAFSTCGCSTGCSIGTVVSYLTSGFLCVYGFDNGWPSIFYIQGILSLLFVAVWCYEAHSRPSHHPRISKTELEFITESKQNNTKTLSTSTPWRSIFTSKPMWATIIVHFSFNWSYFTLLINVPLFLEEVLKFDIKQNGLYSALPSVFTMVFTFVWAKVAVFLMTRKICGTLATRRLLTTTSLVGCSCCLIGAGHITCDVRYIAVGLLCLACVFTSMSFSGFQVNHAEFAGQFAGTTYGITNSFGILAALLAAITPGYLTPNGLQEEWQHVFYVAATVSLIGALVYVTCSSSTLQEWAINRSNITMEVEDNEQTLITNDVDTNNKNTNEHISM